ncbi:NAD(P)/FAD-dependent oxidoreductase [Labrys sp. KNU-23]|uniref:FAD-dependent oxidoreductase n=1 Tax=Labrys sp. KNU-23 TaxID=2789216 RepID=UPI001FEDDE25|nr:NAD(P)/FAD-dependent oxidoreductase [Labrys sp. KNU-23]
MMKDLNGTGMAPDGSLAQMQQTDIVIIGGGLAGVSAATALSRRGYDTTLISARDQHPPDFRAEKLGQAQMELLRQVGLDATASAQMTAFDGVWLYRFGRRVEQGGAREYGSDYADLVNALRRALPAEVRSVVAKVTEIDCGPDRQHIILSDGQSFKCRLVIVATGLGDTIRKKIGVDKQVVSPAHSLCCGFDLARARNDFPFPSLVWTGERFDDRISYLTLFPIGDKVRANLFVYRDFAEEWTRRFRADPRAGLREVMPNLERTFGPIEVVGPVITRPIDLVRVSNPQRDGVVLVGDAFCVVCPITGTGIDKALTDVDRLCNVHIPRWFESPGMPLAKIAQYYADPVKVARDESAMKMSLDSKSIKTDPSIYWGLRRLRSRTLGQARYAMKRLLTRRESSTA